MSKIQKTAESGSPIQFFQKLIPSEALSNETTTMISEDFLRLRYETAQSLKTENPTLATDELARFLENCRIAAAISLGIELRNYLLWEIYSTEQHRQTDQDFVAFGMRMPPVRLAGEVLTHRNDTQGHFHEAGKENALRVTLRVGTWNPDDARRNRD